jgi:DNA polymerase theta
MLKTVLSNPGEKALLVLPCVVLIREKLKWLEKMVFGLKRSY